MSPLAQLVAASSLRACCREYLSAYPPSLLLPLPLHSLIAVFVTPIDAVSLLAQLIAAPPRHRQPRPQSVTSRILPPERTCTLNPTVVTHLLHCCVIRYQLNCCVPLSSAYYRIRYQFNTASPLAQLGAAFVHGPCGVPFRQLVAAFVHGPCCVLFTSSIAVCFTSSLLCFSPSPARPPKRHFSESLLKRPVRLARPPKRHSLESLRGDPYA